MISIRRPTAVIITIQPPCYLFQNTPVPRQMCYQKLSLSVVPLIRNASESFLFILRYASCSHSQSLGRAHCVHTLCIRLIHRVWWTVLVHHARHDVLGNCYCSISELNDWTRSLSFLARAKETWLWLKSRRARGTIRVHTLSGCLSVYRRFSLHVRR